MSAVLRVRRGCGVQRGGRSGRGRRMLGHRCGMRGDLLMRGGLLLVNRLLRLMRRLQLRMVALPQIGLLARRLLLVASPLALGVMERRTGIARSAAAVDLDDAIWPPGGRSRIGRWRVVRECAGLMLDARRLPDRLLLRWRCLTRLCDRRSTALRGLLLRSPRRLDRRSGHVRRSR
ncbi:hypothetical protein, partial [Sphingomonas bacterium]|uniref:hypothetical protein n=1 Tax=Sphingomonas bacterium TaxID=1895847 RepID=UPI00157552E9